MGNFDDAVFEAPAESSKRTGLRDPYRSLAGSPADGRKSCSTPKSSVACCGMTAVSSSQGPGYPMVVTQFVKGMALGFQRRPHVGAGVALSPLADPRPVATLGDRARHEPLQHSVSSLSRKRGLHDDGKSALGESPSKVAIASREAASPVLGI